MDMNQMQELAKAAAHSAVIVRHAQSGPDEKTAVDTYLKAYEYALKQIFEKQQQTQNNDNMEFGSNEAKFR